MLPRAITIHFNKDFLENGMNQLPELSFLQSLLNDARQGLFLKGLDHKLLRQYFDNLMENDPFEDLLKILRLLRYLANAKETILLANIEYNLDRELPQNKRIKKIYEYVFHNFKSNILLSDVASLIDLSEGAFCAYFKNIRKNIFYFFKRN